jgi:hypothetical protein
VDQESVDGPDGSGFGRIGSVPAVIAAGRDRDDRMPADQALATYVASAVTGPADAIDGVRIVHESVSRAVSTMGATRGDIVGTPAG